MLLPILACENVNKAIDYDVHQLGFELAWSMPPNEKGEIEFASVRLVDAEILLEVTAGFVPPEDLENRGMGVQMYINLPEHLDINAVYDHGVSRGAHITKEIQTQDWGERAFNLKDIDGYNLMIT